MSAVPAREYPDFDAPPPTGGRRSRTAAEPAVGRRSRTAPEPAVGRRPTTGQPGRRSGAAERLGRAADGRAAPKATPKAASRMASRVAEPPPVPVTAPRAPFVMLVVVLVAAGIIGLLVLNTRINENSFQLKGLRDKQAELDTREDQLSSALSEKQSPGNLAAAAKRLGLVPSNPASLRLPDGRVFGVPQPGGAPNENGR